MCCQRLLLLAHHIPSKACAYYDTADRCWSVLDLGGRRLPPPRTSSASPSAMRLRCMTRHGVAVPTSSCGHLLLVWSPWARGAPRTSLCRPQGGCGNWAGDQSPLRSVGTPDITDAIRHVNGLPATEPPTSRHLLQWVMHNTVGATLGAGCPGMEPAGAALCAGKGRAGTRAVGRSAGLDGDVSRTTGAGAGAGYRTARVAACRPDLAAPLANMAATIARKSATWCWTRCCSPGRPQRGVGKGAGAGGGGGGGSRAPASPMTAQEEADWDYTEVLAAEQGADLQRATRLWPLSGVAARVQPPRVGALPWSEACVWHQGLYVHHLRSPPTPGSPSTSTCGRWTLSSCSRHWRPWALSIVLLSEREANAILELMVLPASPGSPLLWKGGSVLMHLCYACDAATQSVLPPGGGYKRAAGWRGWTACLAQLQRCMRHLVSAQLFRRGNH